MKSKLSKPLIIINNFLQLWRVLGLAACLVIILGALWVWFNSPRHIDTAKLTPQSSSPLVDNSIKIQYETIQPDGTGENYFVNYRLKRDQFRQETKSMISELLDSTVEKTKIQAQEQWLTLSSKIEKEDEIENLLKIKGFKDLVTDVCPDNVTVIVYASGLTPNEISIIQEVVVRVTNVRLDKIMISTKQ
ncbi:SpoIIIAH-like family protein [Desulfosporosinus sp. SYSU MS00001]|uniref:SpoIIIAH-like family protein n=1 Tax=Desulfosporosinus sp. SYSU MS00001 TaxID=3416284 RepID=UPI003CF518BF